MITQQDYALREADTGSESEDYSVCPSCRYPLEPAWDECPHCAAQELNPATIVTTDPVLIGLRKIHEFWHLPVRDQLIISYFFAEVSFLLVGVFILLSGLVSYIIVIFE